ncbi:hypothetical protein sscle_12g088030 [Sclerotinia sclerotiorum 1980 UF-70]|uniref:Uncharacterized protein n=1 Tax=Sclerotinia sclerotiorum (strain ATCC 18683 / 1980 / Ss-1) TaxID=665079 RepID=A0A1D9QHE1_SCLS1|nr:hypothetical protein sscle_12g088030 [Sclerotinia sclerotiorum 1980 UF-70]
MSNVVAHSTTFSVLVTAVRCYQLGALMKFHSMGSLPLDKEMVKTNLSRGGLEKGAAEEMVEMEGSVDVKHLCFEFDDSVVRLRKGGASI